DAVIEGDALRALRGLDAQRIGRGELSASLHDLHLALLCEAGEAARQLAHDAALPRAKLLQVNPGLAEIDAGVGCFLRLGHHPGDVQQRLRRYAADVQAHAAERAIALDEHHLLAEVGGAEGRRVAAWTRAEDDDFGVDI